MKRVKKKSYPDMDGSPQPERTYMTKNARIDDETLLSKEQMKKEFQSRFGSSPEECFYGKPNGTLLYAGPIPPQLPAIYPYPLQSEQLSFLPEKEPNHGNHYSSS